MIAHSMVAICWLLAVPTLDEIESAMIAYRLNHGPGTMSLTCQRRGESFGSSRDSNETYRYFLDDSQVRFDFRRETLEGEVISEGNIVTGPKGSIRFFPNDISVEGPLVTMKSNPSEDGQLRMYIVNFEVIGASTGAFDQLFDTTLESEYRRTDIVEQAVFEESMNEEKLLRTVVTYSNNGSPFTRETVYSPSKGYAILDIKTTTKAVSGDFISHLRADYQQIPTSNRWFIRSYEITRRLNDKVVLTESVAVTDAQFGTAPDSKVFELASMGIPVGVPVQQDSKNFVWDGKSLAWDASAYVEKDEEPPSSWLTRSKSIVGILAISLGLLLIIRFLIVQQRARMR